MSVVLDCLDKNIDVNPGMLKYDKVMRVMIKPWADYSHEHVISNGKN